MRWSIKTGIVIVFLLVFIVCCWHGTQGEDYYNPKVLATHPEGGDFVGSSLCRECHAEIYASHLHTAHYRTSSLASPETILGPIGRRATTLELGETDVIIGKRKDGIYQQVNQKNKSLVLAPQKIDLVIGSGVKGQSYLTWVDDALFQLQASYYPPTDEWINSPGFPNQYLKRPIRDGCLKCHVTYAANRDFSGQGNKYDQRQVILAVDCERCHRPSAQHVIYHRNNPEATEAKFMLKLDSMPRQKRLDVCAQCHSGPRDGIIKGNAFSFLAGESLEDYSRNFYTGVKNDELDVHGNQYGLLTSSQCFKSSPQMDCGTCHDPHQNQRGELAHFNHVCKTCHQSPAITCKAATVKRQQRQDDCTSCHMPEKPSSMMSMQLDQSSKETAVLVRTHLIGIYDTASWHQVRSPIN